MEIPPITLTDIFIFTFGMVAGTLIGWAVGKLVFSRLFRKREADSITIENAAKYQAIQQGLNYLLGFALGTAAISPQIGLVLLTFWLGVQTFLALKIFGFSSPIHGLTYAFIDTMTDLGVGSIFGTGAATFMLFRLSIMSLGGLG
ncbi:MAG: hypothetical protein ACE5NN_06990 [Candidatus Bathyarchaeia archaeon]